jgi:hypothetical protein
MKRFTSTALLAVSLATVVVAGPTPLYQNFGTVSDSPQIDAIAFANYGTFSASSTLPYDFTDVQYFTNRGTMMALPGFRFDTAFTLGQRRPAISFINETGGSIQAEDAVQIISRFSDQVVSPSYLLVSAQNIVNHGTLLAGAAGLVQLNGTNVDVSRGGLGIGRIENSSTFSASVGAGIYFPDPGLYDSYWGGETNAAMRVGSLLSISKTSTNVSSPVHTVTNSSQFPFPFGAALTLSNPISSVYTNLLGVDPTSNLPTNITRQAAFIAFKYTNFIGTIKWAPSGDPAIPLQSAIIEIQLPGTNVITGDPEFSTLYLMDTLASTTNYLFLTNQAAFPETYLPATYALTRLPPQEWLGASGGKGSLTNTFFFDSKDTNFLPVVTNLFAAYSARVDDLSSEPPVVPLLDPTDYPGRIEINAQNLDISRTRIRGTGLVSIKTPNLLGATNLIVDAENVLFNLGVPTGTLKIQGVIKDQVVRLNGSLSAWSAVWTNFLGINFTNTIPDPSGTGTTNVATNQLVQINYHMLIVDATTLLPTKPVVTHDLITTGDDFVLNDPVFLTRNLSIGAKSFTLNSTLTLSGGFSNWTAAISPNLTSMTVGKAGILTIPNVANFGQDTATAYTGFTNNGFISANGFLIRSGTFVSSGTLTSLADGITIQATSGQFQNATTMSANDLAISGTDLRFTGASSACEGTLILSATHSLSDSGLGASNLFTVHNGFQLPVKPALGDLAGTTIQTFAPRFAFVDHVWAGEDRGPTADGFQDNVALGALILSGDREYLLSFRGASAKNGMYVQFLQLSGSLTNALATGDLGSSVFVDPSLTIYFADSNVPADQLEQQSGGRFVHVTAAATAGLGQNSSSSGDSTQSGTAGGGGTGSNSSGNGTGGDSGTSGSSSNLRIVAARSAGQTSITLSWQAQPQVSYQIEYTPSIQSPSWQPLSNFTNSGAAPQNATVQDQLSGDHGQRYYRVRTAQ